MNKGNPQVCCPHQKNVTFPKGQWSRLIKWVRQIDERVMHLFTFSLFYPDPEERPQTRLAMLATLVPLDISILGIALQNRLTMLLTVPLWFIALCEWRLWYRLRRRNSS